MVSKFNQQNSALVLIVYCTKPTEIQEFLKKIDYPISMIAIADSSVSLALKI